MSAVNAAKRFDDGPSHHWPDPEPIISSLRDVPAFDLEMLPDSIKDWVADVSERMTCPPDYPAVVSMIALSSLIGRKVGIHPKRHDDWLVVPNLWGCLIGLTSAMKTPALHEALKPLRALERNVTSEYEEELKIHETEAAFHKLKREESERRAKRLIKDGCDDDARKLLTTTSEVTPPLRRRYIVNDPTVEKLGELPNENRNGLLLERDELNGILKTLDREDRPNDRAFYLEAFNGLGSYTYDRIGRGTVTIEAAILSLVGTIQPSVIIPYLRKSITQSFDDGLIQRLQLMVYPDPIAFKNVDRLPDQQAKDKAYTTFRLLDAFSAPTDEHGVRGLRFTTDAQALFDDWRLNLEALIRSGEVHPALESHFTKYRSLIPTIALIIQLARRTDYEQVDAWAVDKALAWYRYLRSHAERIYTMWLNNDNLNARTILSKIKHGKLTNPLKAWKIQQAGWGGLTDKDSVSAALRVLVEHGYLREDVYRKSTGRHSTVYHIHPTLNTNPKKNLKSFKTGTEKT